jgi:NAD(P)-dependent dehydrogenase (short-subunit alcohol dehydrogenase family)
MYREKFDLSGSRAVITGGGRGIGLACAEALAEHGAAIVLCDIDAAGLESGRAALAAKGFSAQTHRLDITKSGDVEALAAALNAKAPIDILIANAGIAMPDKPAEATPDEDWLRMLDVNLNGMFWCCRAFGRAMLERGQGTIVTIGSMSGIIANKPQRQTHYNTSKAAVHHMTRSLGAEWGARGVRINSIAPTYIETDMTRDAAQDKAMLSTWMEFTPMGRMGRPDEIAAIALFLASPASSVMTGAVVMADAGYTAW